MTAIVANPKSSTIQIRLSFSDKKAIMERAREIGLSISEYARTILLLKLGVFKNEMKNFWKRIEESEAQHRAGEHRLTSADELYEIGLRARQK
jgi:hypothetical protein